MNVAESKICSKCKTEKLVTDFPKDRSKKDGLSCNCKTCRYASNAAWREKNKDAHAEYMSEYRKANAEKARERTAKWRKDNPEKTKQAMQDWYLKNREYAIAQAVIRKKKNPERSKENYRKWYLANKHIVKVNTLAWSRENKDRCKAYKSRYRAKKLSASGNHDADDIRNLMEMQGGKCPICKSDVRNRYHVDHVIPLSREGSNDKYNLQILCPECNTRKRAKDPVVFMQENGFLI